MCTTPKAPDDMSAHIRTALTHTSLAIPVISGKARAWNLAGDLFV